MQAVYETGSQDLYCRHCPDHSTNTLGYHSHLHYQIELAVIFRGHTRVTIDSTPYDAHGGDIFIVFPNQIHDFRTIEKEDYILLKLSPDLLPELTQFTTALPHSNILRGAGEDPDLLLLIRKVAQTYYGEEPMKDTILRGYLLAFLSKLLQRIELRDVQSGDYHVVGMIMNYCSNNYDKNLSLGMLEKELHLNKYYISHIMSNKLHISFNDYINSLRVLGACKHLIKDDRSITEISEIVGFNTLRTFNRAFQKQMGCTPSEYRRKKRHEHSSRPDSVSIQPK